MLRACFASHHAVPFTSWMSVVLCKWSQQKKLRRNEIKCYKWKTQQYIFRIRVCLWFWFLFIYIPSRELKWTHVSNLLNYLNDFIFDWKSTTVKCEFGEQLDFSVSLKSLYKAEVIGLVSEFCREQEQHTRIRTHTNIHLYQTIFFFQLEYLIV